MHDLHGAIFKGSTQKYEYLLVSLEHYFTEKVLLAHAGQD